MATMTVSLPDPLKEWIEARIRDGEYESSSDYLRVLVMRDRAQRGSELTLEELRHLVTTSKASGVGRRSVGEIYAEAERLAAARAAEGG